MKKVFISSPYTLGDVGENVKRQLDAADELIGLGFAPFTPLLYYFLHIAHPRPYQDWLSLDIEWLPLCDALLRLPGKSVGADTETEYAIGMGIPVFYSMNELKEKLQC